MPTNVEQLAAPPAQDTRAATTVSAPDSVRWISRPASVSGKIFWTYVTIFVLVHLTLLLAVVPWLFTWTGLIMVFAGNYVFCSVGIGLCYHRTLAHRGLVMPKWLEHTFAVLGVCSLMESPARWVAVHRMHHHHSDQQPDPHSPLAGFFWGHAGWLMTDNASLNTIELYDTYARDIMRDPFYFRLERYSLWAWIYVAHAVLFLLVGMLIGTMMHGYWNGGLQLGLSFLLWGVIYRTIYTWHITWAVNSASHRWGYRNYQTRDNSRNNWLVAVATNGEGWHNNHHAYPRCTAHGHRWWELDVTYRTIQLLKWLGLARAVVGPDRISSGGFSPTSARDW